SKMDCPTEEQIVRMRLEGLEFIKHLQFDLSNRILTVIHNDHNDVITKKIDDLNLNSSLIKTEKIDGEPLIEVHKSEKKVLVTVLIINAAFFLIEFLFGWVLKSMGLVADSLDMLADASVYGLSLYAVGKALSTKKHIAKLSGYF